MLICSPFSEFMYDRRDVLPVRSADVHHEVRVVDVHGRPGLAHVVQQQGLRRPQRLLEVRHVGHHRGKVGVQVIVVVAAAAAAAAVVVVVVAVVIAVVVAIVFLLIIDVLYS